MMAFLTRHFQPHVLEQIKEVEGFYASNFPRGAVDC